MFLDSYRKTDAADPMHRWIGTLVSGIGRSIGRPIEISTLGVIYKKRYKEGLFPKLLDDPSVPPEDKKKIKKLLIKPWNLYISMFCVNTLDGHLVHRCI